MDPMMQKKSIIKLATITGIGHIFSAHYGYADGIILHNIQ